MVADGAGEEHLISRAHAARRQPSPRVRAADAGGGYVQAVRLAVLDDLGVAAHDLDPGPLRGFGDRPQLGLQGLGGDSLLDHEGEEQGERLRRRDREVVHRAIDRQLADRAAGETQRAHHEAVGSEGEAGAVHLQVGGIGEGGQERTAEERRDQAFDQPPAGLAPGAVGHLDAGIAEADPGESGRIVHGGLSRLHPSRLPAAAMRCT